MTIVVAVLLTHMLKKAVTAMIPAIMRARAGAGIAQDGQRDPLVQAPDMQRAGQQETAEETERSGDARRTARFLDAAHDAEQREQDQRQQRRDGERQGLGHPPDGHPGSDRGGPPALRREPLRRRRDQQDCRGQRPRDQGRSAGGAAGPLASPRSHYGHVERCGADLRYVTPRFRAPPPLPLRRRACRRRRWSGLPVSAAAWRRAGHPPGSPPR